MKDPSSTRTNEAGSPRFEEPAASGITAPPPALTVEAVTRLTDMAPPSASDVRNALLGLEAEGLPGHARLLWATVVGSWADGTWSPRHDVDLRAIYVLPTRDYLGLGSFLDEFEVQASGLPWELDLVAFEVEKAARLILKGHRPTLSWLSCDIRPPLYARGPETGILTRAARHRCSTLARPDDRPSDPSLPPDLYSALDTLIIDGRMGNRFADQPVDQLAEDEAPTGLRGAP